MTEKTTRQRIIEHLRFGNGNRPSSIAEALSTREIDLSPQDVVNHVHEIKHSLDDEQVLVAPPECNSCGFDGFDNVCNMPSRCPECKGTWIEEPLITIE